jgi:signal peptidase I
MSSAANTQADSKGPKSPKGESPRRRVRIARELLKEAERLLKKKGKLVPPSAVQETQDAVAQLVSVLPKKRKEEIQAPAIREGTLHLDRCLTDHFGRWRKTTLREYIEAIAWAVGLALIIRAFIFEAFSIPSGSMMPTLQIGDYLFVDKMTHGLYVPFSSSRLIHWSEPDRGDIIVFEYSNLGDAHDGEDFIKRVVAVAGDSVRLENNRLILNGKPVLTEITEPDATCDFYGEDNATEPLYQCPCVRQNETLGEADDPSEWETTFTTQHIKDGWALQKGCKESCKTDNSACASGSIQACKICFAECFRYCHGQSKSNWSLSYITREAHALDRVPIGKFRPDECSDDSIDPDFSAGVPGCGEYNGRADLVVPDDHVFVMGDNRDHSKDGRFWGLVPTDRIKGRAFVIWLARDKGRMFTWL